MTARCVARWHALVSQLFTLGLIKEEVDPSGCLVVE
jgi:hypothetical protein